MTICGRVDSYHYSRSYGKCYWCERTGKLGVDIFPGNSITSSTAVKTTTSSTVIQNIPSSTPTSQTSTQPSWQSLGKIPFIKSLNAVITGSIIGLFFLVGLSLTKQQTPSTQISSPQLVKQDISLAPSISDRDTSISRLSKQIQESNLSTPEPINELPSPTPAPEPIKEIPNPTPDFTPSSISQKQAVKLINSWLEAKKVMFAPPYNRAIAAEITTGEQYRKALGLNGLIAQLKSDNAYFHYGIQKIDSVDRFTAESNQATIQVKITEDRILYRNRKIDARETDFKTRAVRYKLRLVNGQWKIASSRILKEY